MSIVADTLRKHRATGSTRVSHLTDGQLRLECWCREWVTDHDAHMAAAVVDALGGLGRAWAAVLSDDSYFTPYHEGHEFHPGEAREQAVADVAEYEDSRLSSRWVSGWVREPAEEAER